MSKTIIIKSDDKTVKFSHDYDKLMRKVFPTVRSRDYMEEHKIVLGDICEIISPSMRFKAKLLVGEDWRLCDLEESFLAYDCAPLECNGIEDYIKLLDSFAKYPCHKPTTTKRVLWWEKV